MSKVCTLRSQGTGSQRGDGLGEPRWGQGCQHLEGHLHSPALHLPRPHIINHGLFFFFLWSLDVTAGKNLTRKQMQGREILMFWILRKWLPWQQGARERTSFFGNSMWLVSDGLGSASNGRHCPEPKPTYGPRMKQHGVAGWGETQRPEREGRGVMDR